MTTPGDRVPTRDDFSVRWPVTTRWSDNDVFGHLNNAVYYELFDTAINAWLHRETGTDARTAPSLGLVVESGCRFLRELAFPSPLEVGIAVTRIGRSSVTYRLGLFDDAPACAAVGSWVHVYVDATTRRPVEMPAAVRTAAAGAQV